MNNQAIAYENLIQRSPNLRRFLDLIGWAEGATYNTGYGGRNIPSLADHPYRACAFLRSGAVNTSGQCSSNTTSAAGKYQYVRDTWNSVKRSLGLPDFSAQSQDIGAVKLIADRGALQDVLNGNITSAIQKLKPEWESFKVKPLSVLLSKFQGGNINPSTNVNPSMSINPDIQSATQWNIFEKPEKRDKFQGKVIFGEEKRYLFAFAILAIVFIFAFKR